MKSFSVAIQIKDTEHFPVILVIMPYNLAFESVNEI